LHRGRRQRHRPHWRAPRPGIGLRGMRGDIDMPTTQNRHDRKVPAAPRTSIRSRSSPSRG